MIRDDLKRLICAALLLVALCAGLAQAETVGKGNLRLKVDGALKPRKLPRTGAGPVSVALGGEVSTTDGTAPPQLRKIEIEINRHGHFDYTGLPTCELPQIQPASNGRALANCKKALVGDGTFAGSISLPGQEAYPIEGRLLVFNGREHGHQVLMAHIYTPKPFATSFVIQFSITTKPHGTYGTILTADLRKALGRKRNLTAIELKLSRQYGFRGKRYSYVSAGCPAPKGFHVATYPLARTAFTFGDGRVLSTVLNRTCAARG